MEKKEKQFPESLSGIWEGGKGGVEGRCSQEGTNACDSGGRECEG